MGESHGFGAGAAGFAGAAGLAAAGVAGPRQRVSQEQATQALAFPRES